MFSKTINELRSHSIGLFEQDGFCLFLRKSLSNFSTSIEFGRMRKNEGGQWTFRLLLEVKRSFHFPIEVPFVMIFQRHAVISHQNAMVFKLL